MPEVGEIRRGKTETVQWDGQKWADVHEDQGAPQGQGAGGVLPSGLSMLGGLLGMAAPAAAIPGAALGSAVNELSSSVPKLVEMARHGGGLFGPMSSEGVGSAMAEPAKNIALDTLKNTALNMVPGAIGKGLDMTGKGLEAIGASKSGAAPIAMRMAVGPALHMLGVPEGPAIAAEAASVAGPAAARALAPTVTRAGEAMPSSVLTGLRAAAAGFKGPQEAPSTTMSNIPLSADALSRNVDATNMTADGFSRDMAGKLAGIPGAGESSAQTLRPMVPENEPTWGGRVQPQNSVDDILATMPRSKVSGGSGEGSDLFQQALDSQKSGQSFDWPEAGGRYEPDAIGSHKLVGASPDPPGASTFDMTPGLSEFQKMSDSGAFGGDRTTGQFTPENVFTGKPTGLAGVSPADYEKLGAGSPEQDIEIPTSDTFSPEERLAARSMERFGRRFRSESTSR